MKSVLRFPALVCSIASLALITTAALAADAPPGFVSLFNGRDLANWVVPEGDNGHWKVLDGVIDYDARSEAKKKDLWTEKEYGDFTLKIDWKIKEMHGLYPMPEILPSGDYKLGPDGKPILTPRPNADSGIYLRGSTKSQVNIWCWPCGSGEIYGYRMDKKMPPEVRAGCVPKVCADKPVGEWNTFEITMKGDRLTVVLNGQTVIENVQLPKVPAKGRIGLQHHGGFDAKKGEYAPASSLMQFRNVFVKELN
jgi:Domain of Unknown Function (DUF1080)